MRQLTSLDNQFLALENSRQTGHVGGLAVLDPSTTATGVLTSADIQALLVERLPMLPPLRWRLAEVPLGLDYPYWVDDADFDLDFHVRELALPMPGSDAQLAEQVARISRGHSTERARCGSCTSSTASGTGTWPCGSASSSGVESRRDRSVSRRRGPRSTGASRRIGASPSVSWHSTT